MWFLLLVVASCAIDVLFRWTSSSLLLSADELLSPGKWKLEDRWHGLDKEGFKSLEFTMLFVTGATTTRQFFLAWLKTDSNQPHLGLCVFWRLVLASFYSPRIGIVSFNCLICCDWPRQRHSMCHVIDFAQLWLINIPLAIFSHSRIPNILLIHSLYKY